MHSDRIRMLPDVLGFINLKKDYSVFNIDHLGAAFLWNLECRVKGGNVTAKDNSQRSSHCYRHTF